MVCLTVSRGGALAARGRRASGVLETAGSLPDALIEGIEWPSGSKRSVVVMVARDEAAIPSFLSAFLRSSQSSDISQSVSVLHGAQFSSYRIGNAAYWSGEISPLTRATRIFQQFPWLIAIVVVIFCFLMAVLTAGQAEETGTKAAAGRRVRSLGTDHHEIRVDSGYVMGHDEGLVGTGKSPIG